MDAIEILKQLKDKGVRFTPQRQAILEFLLGTTSHPTADEIYHHVKAKFPGVSLGTIYNTLNMLKVHGHLLELSYGDMSSRFDGNPQNHYHIVCSKCGKVVDFHRPLIDIAQEAQEKSGFTILGHRLELYGICPECNKSEMLN
ncbi:Fe2+/Zn2+ uptake regulation protein [Desulfosporosinus acidiphilus SJ4]|uniref:Fe2+/Zn2+ uptake regulation protein n=1 Tax=Desulfosporosinus acidiphilus (strain DSM 22704 / JCM 16185 / SJ4) TaxID=646529 RepID=I4DA29_DESAJ|nr:transcriptional repressor [Desulfosporosinus acidiphilus]AFM42653.1 Fe2+/Zn2+ uptake regulation protein [Desulfosporosinus acidiphilus SJ4]